MSKRYAVSLYRLGFAILTVAAIITQFVSGSSKGNDPVNFFSFFTIQSNILAAIVLLVGSGVILRTRKSTTWDLFRGGATLYIAMTGVIYALFLSGLEVSLQTTVPWVNTVLHYLTPFVLVIDWLALPPTSRVPFKRALLWITYPLAYIIYSLVRGHFVQWYPYPFLNVAEHGYVYVLTACVFLSVGVIALIALLSLSGGKRKK
jgi:hypothetical protein